MCNTNQLKPVSRARREGAALVVSLLVVVVLSIIVTAFLQSMSVERLSARSHLNLLRAEQAADGAAAEAIARVINLKLEKPYHAFGYKDINGQITPIFLGDKSYEGDPRPNETSLVSGNPLNVPTLDSTNSIELNLRRDAADDVGWIGSPIVSGTSSYRSHRALWVKLVADRAKPEQPDPAAADYNPVVARFAYWIDDETAKLDVGVNGNADGPDNRFKRSDIGKAVTDLDLGALPMLRRAPLEDNNEGGTILGSLVTFRNSYPFLLLDPRVLNRMSPANLGANVADDVKFHATISSWSDDLAGTGRRRVNLNNLVTNSLDPRKIAADLDDIGWVITGAHYFKASLTPNLDNSSDSGLFLDQAAASGPLSTFGSRFYTGAGSSSYPDIYVKEIAANIRDYIDTDSQPTLVDPTGLVISNTRPTVGWSVNQPKPQALGKEAIPYLQEHAWRGFIESWNQVGSGAATVVTATLRFDHYFEFFNPNTKDFTAPSGTFLKVYNFPPWLAGTFPNVVPPDFEMDLANLVFPAGKTVVVTTNTTGTHPPGLLLSGTAEARSTTPANAVRKSNVQSNETISTVKGFQLQGRSSSTTDYRTEFLWGNNQGFYDFFPAISISLSSAAQWNFTNRGSNVQSQTRFVYSSSLRGNDEASRSGDPRSLSEQIQFKDWSSGGDGDQTRFFGNIQGHGDSGTPSIPGTATFGKAAISFVDPVNWPDYNPALDDTSNSAYAVVRDGALETIGELGNIYDPSRKAAGSVVYARGGGRSLKIGQPDDVVPSTRASTTAATTSWSNAAWRLTDLFAAGEDVTKPAAASSAKGKINPNGILRDNGVAFKAALRKFVFLPPPAGDTARTGKQVSDAEIETLVSAIRTYLTANGPLMERGEISQIPFFSGSGTANQAGGIEGAKTLDRSREEIVRRIIELTTTRSDSFTVYVAGEAIRQNADGKLVTQGRHIRRVTFQLEPQHAGKPLDTEKVADKADAFKVHILNEAQF